ncbi:MAG: hypothetical protein OQK74_02225, partial [Gammaproteobacteria bacterium]|nr:hypothetical protein [Gammaproteobacteria bacterium]
MFQTTVTISCGKGKENIPGDGQIAEHTHMFTTDFRNISTHAPHVKVPAIADHELVRLIGNLKFSALEAPDFHRAVSQAIIALPDIQTETTFIDIGGLQTGGH